MKTLRFGILMVLALAALAAVGEAGNSRSGSISGRVVSAPDGLPVVGIWVEIEESGVGVLTDSLGQFVFENLKPATYHLIITGVGRGTFRDLPGLELAVTADVAASTRVELPEGDSGTTYYDTGSSRKMDRLQISTGQIRTLEKSATVQESRAGEGERQQDLSGYSNLSPKLPAPPPGLSANEPYYDEETGGEVYPHDMYFADYGTNGFVNTRRDPRSTFAADVDDASYNVIKGYLERRALPPEAAIRVEEFLNHFDYGYNPPNDEKFRIFAELTPSPFDPDITMLKLGIKGREIDRSRRAPINLTLVIDESGSMSEGNRLELVKQAVRTLVQQLDRNDEVGVVAYNSSARVVLDPVSADNRSEIINAVSRLWPNNRTNAEAGLALAYRMAGRQFINGHNNLVVLFSDGVANVGRTGSDEIMSQIGRFARGGITLHTYGVGMGNYNDVLLEQLAQRGNGQYAYINSPDQIPDLFVHGFVAATELLARDMKVQVEFNDQIVKAYRLLGYENREVADNRFRDNRQDGGEIGSGHEVTALYELRLTKTRGKDKVAELFVRWKDRTGAEVSETSRVISLDENYASLRSSRPELRLAIAAARFGEVLKGTVPATDDAFSSLWAVVEPLQHEMGGEQTEELVRLIKVARELNGRNHPWIEKDHFSDNYRR